MAILTYVKQKLVNFIKVILVHQKAYMKYELEQIKQKKLRIFTCCYNAKKLDSKTNSSTAAKRYKAKISST